ncbi:inorganic phosphate transporter [Alteribacillus iranensis]|uniref:Sulfate permease n=1 Tax=Alteribacillus iranensis TaxID=930128 RepID=A0A1I1ZXG6_9BACI|nr:inorganic phosphate transporter [Alteribacillus iranensis]SFE36325.1 sulfate permease [Alteribacillus iranensis]
MDWIIAAYIIAFFFAMNIGASGTAASMGPAYGSGAIKKRSLAVFLAGISAFAGALAGGEVVKTIGEGIIPHSVIEPGTVVIILCGACFTLFIANILGIPLSTSEVVIGSLVGVGLAYKDIYIYNLVIILIFWFIIPCVSFLISFFFGKVIQITKQRYPLLLKKKKWKSLLPYLLIAAGLTEAFAAGMNNVGNAVGPLVGAGVISVPSALFYGGIFLGLGCMLLGGKVLETNGKRIIPLSVSQGIAVSTTGGSLVIAASLAGIPVPLTQVTTTAIAGIGASQYGMRLWQKSILRQIVNVWLLSPVVSLVVSYALMMIFIHEDLYTCIVLMSVFIATLGSIHLSRLIKKEKSQFHDEGSGI